LTITDYFIFYFSNTSQISFSQFFIFYFFIFSSIFFIKNYLYCIKFTLFEFPFILISIFIFIIIIIYVDDFILLYFCLEGLGFSTYIFFGLLYNNQYIRYEGVLKYFILNSFASILFLFGTTFIYFSSLSINYNVNILLLNNINNEQFNNSSTYIIGLVFIILSFFFKLGIFPCLIWIIDIYESLPFALIFILITLYKFILFLVFIRLIINVFFPLIFIWQPILLISGISSLGISCIGALLQHKLKRFIGYTSVNQISYVILGLSCGTNEGILAAYNFLIFYIIVNTLFFSFLIISQLTKKIYSEYRYLTDLTNLSISLSNSILFIFIIIIISIISLPPIANFFIKYDLIINLLQISNFIIFIILIFSVISAFYYIRLLKLLFFDRLITLWTNKKIKILNLNFLLNFNIFILNFYLYCSHLLNTVNKNLLKALKYYYLENNFISFLILLTKINFNIINPIYLHNLFLIIDFWTIILFYTLL